MSDAFISRVSQLQRDPLHAARAAAKRGERVIGYVGDVPIELIFAANAVPVRLQGNTTAPTPRANAYLESAFMPDARVVLEQWLSSELDFIDAVIFSRSNDSAQRLYYYLCELQRTKRCAGPTPLLFDVATISRPISLAHTMESVRRLAAELRCDLSTVHSSIQRVGERVRTVNLLHTQRVATPSLVGSEAHRVHWAAEQDWSTQFDHDVRKYLSSASHQQYSRRLLLVGNTPPDERLHVAAENGDATIVHELTDRALTVADVGEPLAALADRHHRHRTPAQQMLDNQICVADLARHVRADGVIFWAIEEDEVLPWEVARQTASLNAANIPLLSLTRQQWLADEATLQRISHFARTLEAR